MVRRALLVLALLCVSASADGQTGNSFSAYLEALWPEAAKEGISRTTFNAAFAGLTLDPGVIAAMRREPEYGKPFGAYVASLASPSASRSDCANRRNGLLHCAPWKRNSASTDTSLSASGESNPRS